MSFGMDLILVNIKKFNFKSLAKEILIGVVMLFVVSNVMSYIRRPTLASNVLPKIEATLLDGRPYRNIKGKPIMIHFWATWCPTCKLEASNIEEVSKRYEVLTIAVNSGGDKEIQAYMQDKGLTFAVLNDKDSTWAKKFKVEAYPTTFIYDGNGTLKFTEVGYTTIAGLLARLKMSE